MIRPDYSNTNFMKPIADLSATRFNFIALRSATGLI